MPFECANFPAVTSLNNGASIIVLQGNKHFLFDIYKHYVEWDVARIIWIAFYKNVKNDKCFINTLPKDLVKYIFTLLGGIYDSNKLKHMPHIKI